MKTNNLSFNEKQGRSSLEQEKKSRGRLWTSVENQQFPASTRKNLKVLSNNTINLEKTNSKCWKSSETKEVSFAPSVKKQHGVNLLPKLLSSKETKSLKTAQGGRSFSIYVSFFSEGIATLSPVDKHRMFF